MKSQAKTYLGEERAFKKKKMKNEKIFCNLIKTKFRVQLFFS